MKPGSKAPTIIVGYDGRPESADAVALANTLARPLDGRVVIACVHFLDEGDAVAVALEQATIDVDDDIEVERVPVPARSVARGLHELAESRGAALVVLGAGRHGRVGGILLGSVVSKLLHGSPCAVAIAPRGFAQEAREPRVIAAALDLSPESELAVARAAEIALAARAALRVIAVVEPVEYGYAPVMGSHALSYAGESRKALDERIDRLVRELPAELRVDARVSRGNVCAHILGEATRGVDLLVMGSRGFGPVGAVLLGSVSARVVESAPCPVMVVPRGSHAAAAETEPEASAATA